MTSMRPPGKRPCCPGPVTTLDVPMTSVVSFHTYTLVCNHLDRGWEVTWAEYLSGHRLRVSDLRKR